MARRTGTGSRHRLRGMALVMVLVAVTVIGLATLVPLRSQQQVQQRERERELLFVGDQYRRAIASYAAATPVGAAQYPKSLADLLEDKRFPGVRRHLRRLYPDPVSRSTEWTLLREQGAIVGVASPSTRVPLKHSGFDAADRDFADASTYADWKFLAQQVMAPVPVNTPVPPVTTPTPGSPGTPPPATLPPPPAANPGNDKRNECGRAYSGALNVCARDPLTSLECRGQARTAYLACLRG